MAQVFLSWSGDRSKSVADALKLWLPRVLQGLDVWMSDHDIRPGERWERQLGGQLEQSSFGVVCLTPENLKSAWLIFEAGALSKAITESRVAPYRFGLKTSDVGPPLAQFQGVDADRRGTLDLVASIHNATGSRLPLADLQLTFDRWWPDLETSLATIGRGVPANVRSERDMLEEILDLVRRTASRELQSTLGNILAMPNVHSIHIKHKRKLGQESGVVAFRVCVHQKLPLADIPEHERIPEFIYGMPTDVVQVQNDPT